MSSNELEENDERRHWIISCIAMWVIVPVAFMAFMLAKHDLPHAVAIAGSGVLVSTAIWLRRRSRDQDILTISRLLIGSAILIIAMVCCNHIYLHYDRNPHVFQERGEFRLRLNTRHWPMISRRNHVSPAQATLIALSAAGVVLWLWKGRVGHTPLPAVTLLISSVLLIALIAIFAYGGDRSSEALHFDTFRFGLDRFSSAADLLKRYVHDQPDLGTFNRHYPPGMMLSMLLEKQFLVPGRIACINICLTAATIFAIAQLVGQLGGEVSEQRWAIGLFATCTGVLIYPSITPTTFLTLPTTTIVLLFVAMVQKQRLWLAASLGFALAAYVFFSFQAGMVIILLIILATRFTVQRKITFGRMTILTTSAVISFCVAFAALRLVSGFDIWQCFIVSTHDLNRSNGPFFDSFSGYPLRVSGNILAFVISIGFALAVPLFCNALRFDRGSAGVSFGKAVAATIVIAGAIGMGRMETERVWLPMVPLVAVASAQQYSRWGASSRLLLFVLVSAAIIACSQGILLRLGST